MITTVTVTGADDSTPHSELIKIADEYPFVEFAILLSRKSIGTRRFPSAKWLSEIVRLPGHVRLAGHICGSWVREIYQGKWPVEELQQILGIGWKDRFERIQLNTHGIKHKWNPEFVNQLSFIPRKTIFQYDRANSEAFKFAEASGVSVAALFDLSHGCGVLPSEWPVPLEGVECGYAGGLSPENVAEQCGKIKSIVGDRKIWIDAETHLRSPDDTVFDLNKVRAFIENAKPFVAV
jgi:hypothetical protein